VYFKLSSFFFAENVDSSAILYYNYCMMKIRKYTCSMLRLALRSARTVQSASQNIVGRALGWDPIKNAVWLICFVQWRLKIKIPIGDKKNASRKT
jgi:hypothetical protein